MLAPDGSPLVPIAALTRRDDWFRCTRLSTTFKARSCVGRQAARGEFGKPLYPMCATCPDGADVATRLGGSPGAPGGDPPTSRSGRRRRPARKTSRAAAKPVAPPAPSLAPPSPPEAPSPMPTPAAHREDKLRPPPPVTCAAEGCTRLPGKIIGRGDRATGEDLVVLCPAHRKARRNTRAYQRERKARLAAAVPSSRPPRVRRSAPVAEAPATATLPSEPPSGEVPTTIPAPPPVPSSEPPPRVSVPRDDRRAALELWRAVRANETPSPRLMAAIGDVLAELLEGP